jgi:hypothetical protein
MKLSDSKSEAGLRWLAVVLGVTSFTAVLTSFNLSDGDLWAKLSLGAHVLMQDSPLRHDIFAFTPVLPEYIDHEWGAGTIFYACLKWFGPASLMVLKLLLAFGALATAMMVGRRLGCGWNSLLCLAIPSGACILPAYAPVLRSHTFTFFFFGATLLCLEEIRAGKKWPAFILPVIMLIWANVHGGFVAGLCTIGVYTVFAIPGFPGGSLVVEARRVALSRFYLMLLVSLACLAVTVINPYGFKFWTYLIPALLNKRPEITEWKPLPVFGTDVFVAFRLLFVLVVIVLLVSWRHTKKKSWPGLVMLLATAFISWRSRRHAPFFGVATLAFVGPFVEVTYARLVARFPKLLRGIRPAFAVTMFYCLMAVYAATSFLPRSSFQILSPVGLYPVREVDILSRAQAEGNLAIPFRLGSYATWRLYPRIKVSIDGRYEANYPEPTFRLNEDFFTKSGTNWDRLIRDYNVPYVILDWHVGTLRPEDLYNHGYVLIWLTEGYSALMVQEKYAAKFHQVAAELPETTIDPLDARIPEKWWSQVAK